MVGPAGGCLAYVIFARLLTATVYFRNLRRSSTEPHIEAGEYSAYSSAAFLWSDSTPGITIGSVVDP